MSKARLEIELQRANRLQGGSIRTRWERKKAGNMFVCVLSGSLGIPLASFTNLRVGQIEAYVRFRKTCGVSLRSLQNELAHVRQILRALGRSHFAAHYRLSNQSLLSAKPGAQAGDEGSIL